MANEHYEVIIIGSGPAALTAAIYTGRANLNPLIFEGDVPGGQLTTTTDVENYPGFPEGIMGPELMDKMKKQAERFGAKYIQKLVTTVSLNSKAPFHLKTDSNEYTATTLIISTGATPKFVGIPGEQELLGKGVSTCATCDGFFFKGEDIVVVGGGDSAMEEAIFLTKFAKTVTIIHRREEFRASKIMLDRARKNKKIGILMNTTVTSIEGSQQVENLKIKNTKSGEETDLKAGAIFIAIGHIPNTKFLDSQLPMDENGYLITLPGKAATEIPGVFACGDVTDHYYRQAVTAAGMGCMAAIECEKWIESTQ